MSRALQAAARYNLGGDSYEDPVPFDKVFEIVDEVPQFTFEPVITVSYFVTVLPTRIFNTSRE